MKYKIVILQLFISLPLYGFFQPSKTISKENAFQYFENIFFYYNHVSVPPFFTQSLREETLENTVFLAQQDSVLLALISEKIKRQWKTLSLLDFLFGYFAKLYSEGNQNNKEDIIQRVEVLSLPYELECYGNGLTQKTILPFVNNIWKNLTGENRSFPQVLSTEKSKYIKELNNINGLFSRENTSKCAAAKKLVEDQAPDIYESTYFDPLEKEDLRRSIIQLARFCPHELLLISKHHVKENTATLIKLFCEYSANEYENNKPLNPLNVDFIDSLLEDVKYIFVLSEMEEGTPFIQWEDITGEEFNTSLSKVYNFKRSKIFRFLQFLQKMRVPTFVLKKFHSLIERWVS